VGLVGRIDDFGKMAWIGLMVLGFVFFWPVGLAILFFLIGSGRMGSGRMGHMGCSRSERGEWRRRWKEMKQEFRAARRAERHGGERYDRDSASGNSAFDEYRAETLQRLEAEQQEFYAYLDRLRHAKDKAEFDQFMAEHRSGNTAPPAPPSGDSPQR